MSPVKVLVDANVLWSRTVRDWLLMLQLELRAGGADALFTLYWTEDILAELMYGLRRANPHWDGYQVRNIRDRCVAAMEGGRIDTYPHDPNYPGADPDDAHLHAAATAAQVDYVLTADRKWLPRDREHLVCYELYTPDDFLCLVDDNAGRAMQEVVWKQLRYELGRRPEPHLPHRLRQARCPNFAERVRQRLQSIDQRRLAEEAAGTPGTAQ